MGNWTIVDAVLAPSAIALLLAYHAFLFYKLRTCPLQTLMGINDRARRLWVYEMRTENHKKNVLAVQTLRNSIMESTLLATTTVLLTTGLAAYFTFANNFKQLPGGDGTTPSSSSSFGGVSTTVKSFGILSCFMVSFLCHTQSIRFLNHVNYMINTPSDHLITSDYVAKILERGTFMHGVGARIFYVAFPLLLWVFGSVPMLLCTIVLLYALYTSDFVHCKLDSQNIKVVQHQNGMDLQS